MTVPATAANTAAPRTHHPARIIGCDVGKSAVVVFDSLTGRTTEHANDAEALAALAADLARDAPADCLPADCLVVCEATGGYESTLLAAVAAAGIPAHRADARKVKAFIRSSAASPRPTSSMPARSPATARSAMPNSPAGSRRRTSARTCARSPACAPSWSASGSR